jgi:DNA-binding transcriptional ArsR family regulator
MSRRQSGTDVFAAIADPTRRAILRQLGAGEQSVTRLAGQFDVTLSAISQHIRILREVGLVTGRKAGRERVYRLNAAPLRSVAEWVAFYEPFWTDRLDALETYLDELDETAEVNTPPILHKPQNLRSERREEI